MKKFLITAEMRELEQRVSSGEISYSKMIEMLNEKADEYAKQIAWKAWKYRMTLSEDTQMSEFFLSWWEASNK